LVFFGSCEIDVEGFSKVFKIAKAVHAVEGTDQRAAGLERCTPWRLRTRMEPVNPGTAMDQGTKLMGELFRFIGVVAI
jgi:hypothetical protein